MKGILLSLVTLLHNLQRIQISYSRLRGSVVFLVLSDAEDSLLVERSMSKMMKILEEMEISWSSKQKGLKKERLFENIKKKVSLFLIYFISSVVIGT